MMVQLYQANLELLYLDYPPLRLTSSVTYIQVHLASMVFDTRADRIND